MAATLIASSSRRTSPLRMLTYLFAAAFFITQMGCSPTSTSEPNTKSQRFTWESSPLKMRAEGEQASYAPGGKEPWTASFGAGKLCKTKTSDSIILKRVRYRYALKPLEVTSIIRTIAPADVRRTPARLRKQFLPFIGGEGSPPNITGIPLRGRLTSKIEGFEVRTTCSVREKALARLQRGEVPAGSTDELITVMRVDRSGGLLDRQYIDFTLNGSPATLVVEWGMGACGSRLPPRLCPHDPA